MRDVVDVEQDGFDVRCEWAEMGIDVLGPGCGVLVLVDVLSFSTCVDVVTGCGASVIPCPWRDERACELARGKRAVLASPERNLELPSLSPASLSALAPGTRIVLPSPNGSTLSVRAVRHAPTLAGSLRNATAVADAAVTLARGRAIGVIPCGERWATGTLRPAIEDLAGAGAIISALPGSKSPEATVAVAAFRSIEQTLAASLADCGSGRELVRRGFGRDVELAAERDASRAVPHLVDGAFVDLVQDGAAPVA